MEEILLIQGDNSSIYEFSSKSVLTLDDSWEGSWVISEELGGTPLVEGVLIKNMNVLNIDSLIGEDYKKSFKIFEPNGKEELVFNTDVLVNESLTVSGIVTDTSSALPIEDKYVYITIKGVFVPHTREIRVKTNENGYFECTFDLNKTIKIPANSFFIFQLMPHDTETLELKKYFLSEC